MSSINDLKIECLRAASGVAVARIQKGENTVDVAAIAQEMYGFLSPGSAPAGVADKMADLIKDPDTALMVIDVSHLLTDGAGNVSITVAGEKKEVMFAHNKPILTILLDD